MTWAKWAALTNPVPTWIATATNGNFRGEQITAGTVADARIAATIARDSEIVSATNGNFRGEQITSGTVADARVASTLARDSEVVAATNGNFRGEQITSGTVADARVAATLARDSEVAAATNGNFRGEQITAGTVADARVAATIARDSEVVAATNPIPTWITAATSGLAKASITNGLAPTAWVRATTAALARVSGTITNGHVAVGAGGVLLKDGTVTATQLADAVAYAAYMASNVTVTTSGTYSLVGAAHHYITTTNALTLAMAAGAKWAVSLYLIGTNAVTFPAAWLNYNNTWDKSDSGTNLVYIAPKGTNWVYTGAGGAL
jgi:hypothetical protein